jgi:hypothetical protein
MARMVNWSEVAAAEPEFAAQVQRLFDAHTHKTIATLRADGGPRISGIEAQFADGELTFGSMSGARKGADLRRDPRFALHSASVDPPEGDPSGWSGDAKISGRAVPAGPVTGPADGEMFRADIDEVVYTRVEGNLLVIESWRPDRGLRRFERT